MKQKRSAVIFPNNQSILNQLGQNIKQARKRRSFTQVDIAQRTGLSRITIRRIENGDPHVSMGHYVIVLNAINMVKDLKFVAQDTDFIAKLDALELANA